MRIIADTKPSADVEYLSSAIIKEALTEKFRDLFGRDPVYMDSEEPMRVEDARIPSMIADSVDPQIASMLKSSAIESNTDSSGKVPSINNATLLYTIKADDPAEVSLESLEEYVGMDPASRDSTIHAVSEQDTINITDGVAYLSPERSAINVGVFVDNNEFASEFQYRLEQAGGNGLSPEEKETVFQELFEDLPGGDDVQVPDVRQALLKVVGLTSALSPEQSVPEGKEAPGPETVVEDA